ncbi:MAG: protein kinase [Gemmatimonadetes bacterium]|nr:protein kinase [Gemmatimonadota bacterium]
MTASLERLRAALADRYRLAREIGAGGMATVYLARDIRHDRDVAIKVLKPELGAVLGVERFLSEIRVTANLQHPNLLPLFDSGEAEGLLYYVMPFVEGETLRARLDREQLPVGRGCTPNERHRRRARLRARAWRDSSGPQAGEHPAAGRAAGDRGLRHCAGGEQRRWRARHANGVESRDAAVHEPRAGDRRQGDRRAQRHLLAGRDDL